MGLDMYLKAERYIWGSYSNEPNEEDHLRGRIAENFPELPEGSRIKSVEAEIGYWRKANAVHKWFVDNVQEGKDECQNSFVSREDIERLRDICQKILDDRSLAASLLPTQSGFFFGDTSYSEYYFEDIKSTVEICDRALALPSGWDIYYRSSW